MKYDFREFTDGLETPCPDNFTYSVMELAREHRVLYIIHTKKGDIVMRRLPARLRAVISQSMQHLYPSVQKILAEVRALLPFVEGVSDEELDQEKARRVIELGDQLAMLDMTPLGVVYEPRLGSMDDWDDLYDSLDREDRDRVEKAVREMARERDPEEVDPTAEVLAERYGLRIVEPDMLPAETVSQRRYWTGRIRQENDMIERARQ